MSTSPGWLRGALDLLGADDPPGLSRLPPGRRLRVRAAAAAGLLTERRVRILLWLTLAACLLARACCWALDLRGWYRDLLLLLPPLLVAPRLARLHRARIAHALRRRRR